MLRFDEVGKRSKGLVLGAETRLAPRITGNPRKSAVVPSPLFELFLRIADHLRAGVNVVYTAPL